MATTKSKAKSPNENLSAAEQDTAIGEILNQAFEELIHNILVDVHRSEKTARMQSAVIELEQKAEALTKEQGKDLDPEQVVETKSAILKQGHISFKGNPMTTVKNILCPNCHLPRLLYPRVGFNSRPPPDPNQQYCKNEPAIIIDKHDVHGQRKKGVKVKGQGKGKNKKKKDEAPSPASSVSDTHSPSKSSLLTESFEFKEIEYPAAKCPNKDSHLGDHWKSVNVFATHLNGSCYLKRDRAAGREAVAKMNGTPRDSRASSPKALNEKKRGRIGEAEESNGKKKSKIDSPRKNAKSGIPAPSTLRETANGDPDDQSSFTTDASDTIIAAKATPSRPDGAEAKDKINGTMLKKKPTKMAKKPGKS